MVSWPGMPLSSASRASRASALFALAVRRALGGVVAPVALGLLVLEALGLAALAFAPSVRRGALPELVLVAAASLAWSAGGLLVFGAARAAFRRDAVDGVLPLVTLRGVSPLRWGAWRVVGLAAVVFAALGGALVFVGIAAWAAGDGAAGSGSDGNGSVALPSALVAALVQALAFAATMPPLALALLGHRTRGGGLALLLAVLVVPLLLAAGREGIPAASWFSPLSTGRVLRQAVAFRERSDEALRAVAAVAAVSVLSMGVVAARLRRGGPS